MRLAALALLIASPAAADVSKVAVEVGTVLGSEVACGLKLDPDLVSAYVAKTIPPEETTFANALGMIATGTAARVEAMTPSQKAAHCQATSSSAVFLGLTSKP